MDVDNWWIECVVGHKHNSMYSPLSCASILHQVVKKRLFSDIPGTVCLDDRVNGA